MRASVYGVLRVCLALMAAAFPLFFGSKLGALDWRFILAFFVVTTALGIVEVLYDKDEAAASRKKVTEAEDELKLVSHRLDRQRERGLSMAHLMKVMIPPTVNLERLIETVKALKKEGKAGSAEIDAFIREGLELGDEVITELLKAVSEEVRAYWDAEIQSVRSNLMLAHRTQGAPSDLLQRLRTITKFLGPGRNIESYQFVLELVLWGMPDPEIPPIAVPVDDPTNYHLKKQLIPGAPHAFALGEDTLVSDARQIVSLASPELASNVREELAAYFEGKKVRSFACLILRREGEQIAVLNIQATWPNIFGQDGKEGNTITKSIEQYRYCLEQLIAGQRRLREAAS